MHRESTPAATTQVLSPATPTHHRSQGCVCVCVCVCVFVCVCVCVCVCNVFLVVFLFYVILLLLRSESPSYISSMLCFLPCFTQSCISLQYFLELFLLFLSCLRHSFSTVTSSTLQPSGYLAFGIISPSIAQEIPSLPHIPGPFTGECTPSYTWCHKGVGCCTYILLVTS